MTQPKPIRVCGHLNPRSRFNLSVSGRFDWIVLEVAGGVGGAEPASGFPRGSSIEIAGQQTLVELKRRISSASWRRPKMNTLGLSHCRRR